MSETDEKKTIQKVSMAFTAKIESAKIILLSRICNALYAIFFSTAIIVLLMIWRIFT